MSQTGRERLADAAPELERILTLGMDITPRFDAAEIRRETVWASMRDGTRLATDLYRPPGKSAPTIVVRTPYGRAHEKFLDPYMAFARSGYVVVAQDCRGTGDSEPDSWDYYVYEREDSADLIEWITHQTWFDGFVSGCGGSYLGGTQWCMAMHPRMSSIAPEVCGLGIAAHTVRCHLLLNAYARTVGKGADKMPMGYDELERHLMPETLAGGYFNEPLHATFSAALLTSYPGLRSLPPAAGKRWLWAEYCTLPPARRAELIKQALGTREVTVLEVEALPAVFGHRIAPEAHLLPRVRDVELMRALQAPALVITGWYDWFLDDALATWEWLSREALPAVRSRSRLLIAPSAHLMPGYHEGRENHPELDRVFRTQNIVDLLLRWFRAVREDALDSWPGVTYYLMGANEWHASSMWPPPEAHARILYLASGGKLESERPAGHCEPDCYTYDPEDPTPTVGGSILSFVYPTGSVDASEVQRRADILTYTTEPLRQSWDVVGPLRLILHVSSSAVDTDFAARLSDVFPDGRAIVLQGGILRARYRNLDGEPQLLEPGRVYRLEIDMWATANRFKAGHRLRLDISSADFPRYDRNANRGGEIGPPVSAVQTVFHDCRHPSHLQVSVIPVSDAGE